MASTALKPSILRNVVKRGYAAQAASQQSPFSLPAQEPKVSTLTSGAVVASLQTNAPVSQVSILFKAGARYESANHHGASHIVRSSVGLGTKNKSSFTVTRSIQQAGGSVSCENGREHIIYSLDMIRDNLDTGLEVLGDLSTQPGFKSWELVDNLGRVKDDVARLDPSTIAVELLHKAAYRNTGLGNSVFIPKHLIGSLTTEKMQAFLDSTHTASRMAVVGHGVDHDALVAFTYGLGLSNDAGAADAAIYGGGEVRQETGSGVTCVAVAGSGASLGSSDAAALAVAQQILGVGPRVKYGNANSLLEAAVSSVGGVASASGININYTDGGLFGYFIIAESGSAGQAVGAVHNALKNANITDADVARAKAQVKGAIVMASESTAVAVEDMGLQALLTGKYVDPVASAAAIDGVTASAVRSAINKALGGKLSMGAVGSLSGVPYLDQL